ncbi:MAG: hypothetical protein H7Z72_07575 [Bacteroidetes bacterium]|nr:hypothetical protein [Fibrella sp.]
MKKSLIIVILLSYGLIMPLFAQSADKIRIRLKNNGLLPREFKFVTRHPDEKYPDVFTTYLAPGAVYEADFRVGTSLAQVTQAEINATMKGRNVPGKPLLVVKANDSNKIVNLIQ